MNCKMLKLLTVCGLCLSLLCACKDDGDQNDAQKADTTDTKISYDENDYYQDYEDNDYTEIVLDKEKDTLKITEAGTYELHGTLQGQILIQAGDNDVVRLVLKNAVITASNGPAVLCTKADKLILSLYEGSENHISDSQSYQAVSENEEDAAIFVQDDLTINGKGSLSVNAQYQDAVKAKDTLKLMEGDYQIQAADDGIVGKDAVYIHDGSYQVNAQGDAVKSTYDKDDEKGDIAIENGTFQLKAGLDGIQAEKDCIIYNGDFVIESGGGSANGATAANAFQPGGFGMWERQDTASNSDTQSAKGIKAQNSLAIYDGSFDIDAGDDALHSNGDITLTNGSYRLASGDDGVHSDAVLTIHGGRIDITQSYEGLEGSDVVIYDGYIQIVSIDDGINSAGGSDSDNEAQPSPDHFKEGGNHTLEIHGGNIQVDAQGDGLDANGAVTMDGGSVVVFGPSDGANGALDYDTSFVISGGILIATGSSQMAQAPSEASTQNAIMVNLPQQEANSLFYIADEAENALIGVAPTRAYSNVIISTPDLKTNQSYQLYTQGSGDSSNDAGYVESKISGGTLLATVTLDSVITQYGQGGMGDMGQGRGQDPGSMPLRPDGFPQGHERGQPPQ